MLTQRLGSDTEKDNQFVESLIKAIKENPGSCDEVWLASDYGFPKIEVHRMSAEKLMEVSEKFRAEGIRVSLQISNTVGHGQYMNSRDCSGLVYENSPVEKMVGADGIVADYCFCWNGKHFREYVISEIKEYAKILPYCVWFDDDLRASNHYPVEYGCFCDNCIGIFNHKHNSNFSRKELVNQINFGDIIWRERYVEFLRDSLSDLTYLMSKAVNEISPDSYVGIEYCAHGGYTGFGYDYIFDAMYRATGKPPKTRPGGGAYSGHNPIEFLMKAYYINWQNVMLPDYITETRPEIENLPDVVFGKSIANTCFETSVYLASGNTAMSYAMLMNDYESMDWHKQMLSRFSQYRPYWQRLIDANKETHQSGIKIAFSKNMWKKQPKKSDNCFPWSYEPIESGFKLWSSTAIPLCYSKQDDDGVFLLHPDNLIRFSDDDICSLLSKPVITDGRCLEILDERGFGAELGATSISIKADTLYEKYVNHEVNKCLIGNGKWRTSLVMDAYHYAIVDKNGTTEPLGIYETNAINTIVTDRIDIANAIITTKQGAKWAVFGHYVWNNIISLDKRNQIIRAADYISNNEVPVILESPIQAVLLPRENNDKKVSSVSVINTTVGETGMLKLRIRRPVGTRFTFMTQCIEEIPLEFTKEGNEYIVFMPSIHAWSVGSIFIEKD